MSKEDFGLYSIKAILVTGFVFILFVQLSFLNSLSKTVVYKVLTESKMIISANKKTIPHPHISWYSKFEIRIGVTSISLTEKLTDNGSHFITYL